MTIEERCKLCPLIILLTYGDQLQLVLPGKTVDADLDQIQSIAVYSARFYQQEPGLLDFLLLREIGGQGQYRSLLDYFMAQ